MNHREPSIHFEIASPRGGIPQLACKNPFKANEITHTTERGDVTCGKCKQYISRHFPKPPPSAILKSRKVRPGFAMAEPWHFD